MHAPVRAGAWHAGERVRACVRARRCARPLPVAHVPVHDLEGHNYIGHDCMGPGYVAWLCRYAKLYVGHDRMGSQLYGPLPSRFIFISA